MSDLASTPTDQLISRIRAIQPDHALQQPDRRTEFFGLLLELLSRTGAAASDLDVMAALKQGQIIIDPFRPSQLKGGTYDVRLAKWWYKVVPDTSGRVFNPYDKSGHDRRFVPGRCISLGRFMAQHPYLKIPDNVMALGLDQKVIPIAGNGTLLGVTEEFIGPSRDFIAEISCRSTVGRLDIGICDDAFLINPGDANRIVLEIRNKLSTPTFLIVGTRVAQVGFVRCGPVERPYDVTGSYKPSNDVRTVRKSWRRELMLPKPLDLS